MASETKATTFVTGADGLIGTELLQVLVASGHQVLRLVSSVEAAQRVRRAGAHAVMGDLLTPVNNDPIRLHEFAAAFTRLADRPLREWRVPPAATRLVVGPVLADHFHADAVFSNIRLRGIGFRFQYPTLEHGLHQIVGALRE